MVRTRQEDLRAEVENDRLAFGGTTELSHSLLSSIRRAVGTSWAVVAVIWRNVRRRQIFGSRRLLAVGTGVEKKAHVTDSLQNPAILSDLGGAE